MKYLELKVGFILLNLLLNFHLSAQTVTVGNSGSCDYAAIQMALNAGAQEIRVVNNQIFNENLYISGNVHIKGGYANCTQATLDQPSGPNTQIDASQDLGYPAVRIESTDTSATMILTRLNLTNAENILGQQFRVGSGLYIEESVGTVILNQVNIFNNKAHNGAGMYVSGDAINGNLNVYLINSKINNNTASQKGGGLACVGLHFKTSITVQANSGIYENQSINSHGGGMYVNGCTVNIASGEDARQQTTLTGVVRNTAGNDGGGIYADFDARINFQGNNVQPATLADNFANNHGGGIAAYDGTQIMMLDALVWKNRAADQGGGLYMDDDTTLVMTTRDSYTCWNKGQCSILAHNRAHLGGAIYQTRGSSAKISNSHIYTNQANWGLVLYSREDGTAGTSSQFNNNMIYRHGLNTFDFDDRYVFRGYEPVSIELTHNTIANNDINDNNSILGAALGATFSVKNSIIHNHDETVYTGPESDLEAACMLVNETSSFSGFAVVQGNPHFSNLSNDDYHLKSNSNAVDLCDAVSEMTHDIDGELRGFNDPRQNLLGTYDAGADETYASDIIFKNGFLYDGDI